MSIVSGEGADKQTRPLTAPGRLAAVELRAKTALPTSDVATVPDDPFEIPVGVSELTLLIRAQRGGVGSKVVGRPRWFCGDIEVEETVTGTPAESGGDVEAPLLAGPFTIEFEDGTEIGRYIGLRVPAGITGLQVDLEDTGTPSTPATVGVHATGGF